MTVLRWVGCWRCVWRRAWLLFLVLVLLFPALLRSDWVLQFDRLEAAMVRQFATDRLPILRAWQAELLTLHSVSDYEKIQRVNLFFHRHVRYRTDMALYGQEDYWATPLELLGHGLGDCEDWAIAKYVSLRHLGIADEQLRLIYVRARIGGPSSQITQAHMVLGYYSSANAEPLILDSLISSVLPASERDDLTPVFSFNSAGLWAGQGAQRANSSPTARLSRWRSVLERMQQDGVQF
ncbi:MAG: transglutaminase-like cysteine peptidase [Bacterioplanes sp.]|nr:transglutaminase-like cysteine peptidase [Bacterioplanes sp.]